MHHVFGTFCLRPSKGSHLCTKKGMNSWALVLWDSQGRASAVSLQSCFPLPAWCVIWVSDQIGFQQFPLSVTFLLLSLPRVMEWLQFRMLSVLLQKHAFPVTNDYFRSCVFLGNFSFQFRPRMASLHEWFSPRKGPPDGGDCGYSKRSPPPMGLHAACRRAELPICARVVGLWTRWVHAFALSFMKLL